MASAIEDKKLIVAPKSLWRRVDQLAKSMGKSRSWLVRHALEKILTAKD